MRMQKKGDVTGLQVLLVAFTTIILVISGYLLTSRMVSSANRIELQNLRVSMENTFREYGTGYNSPPGSVKDVVFSIPSNVQKVCFVGNEKRNMFLDEELEVNIQAERNVYLAPFGDFDPMYVDFFVPEENPLCINVRESTIALTLKSVGSGVKISPRDQNQKEIGCVSARFSRDPDEAMDITFIGSGYSDRLMLADDVELYIKSFLSVEPFRSKSSIFNFFIADGDVNCDISEWVACDSFSANILAAKCPHDFIVVLIPREKISNFINPVRSSSISNIVSLNTADNEMVFTHEFGHAFSGLADEYVDDSYYKQIKFEVGDYPNCDTVECPKWEGKRGTGCFSGCSLSVYSRPTEDSIMRSLKSSDFGPLNREVILSMLEGYK